MIIQGINNNKQTVVVEYEYACKPGCRVIDVVANVVETNEPVEPIKMYAEVPARLNRKMYHWPQQRIDATVQRLVEHKIVEMLNWYSVSGIKGYDVWLKSKQARLHIGQHCNALYKFCRDHDIYVYREAM